MNNKIRQKILKEMKFLLNEAEAVDYSKAKSGGSYGSGGIGRTAATAGIAAFGAGTAGAIAFPVVAVGALVLGAAYLAFRTAGWKEVAEDIDDANIVKDDEVAKRLSTKQYLDLTTMEDATDEADMKSFMAAMKGMAEAYAETETLEEYKDFLEQAKAQKVRLDRICNNFVLLNEFGQNDRMYFVKCAKVTAYQPPEQPTKCVKVEGIQIPVVLYNVELENEIANSQKTFRAPAGELPAITCPLVEKLCGIVEQPISANDGSSKEKSMTFEEYKKYASNKENVKNKNVWYIDGTTNQHLIASHDPSGNWVETKDENGKVVNSSDSGQKATGKGNVKCADEQAIVIYQQWLKYVKKKNISVDGSYGPLTHAAAAAVFGEKETFGDIKKDPQRICKFALEHKAEWSDAIQKANPKVKVGQKETGRSLEESKQFKYENFYNSRKEKEANLLFEKLMRKL